MEIYILRNHTRVVCVKPGAEPTARAPAVRPVVEDVELAAGAVVTLPDEDAEQAIRAGLAVPSAQRPARVEVVGIIAPANGPAEEPAPVGQLDLAAPALAGAQVETSIDA